MANENGDKPAEHDPALRIPYFRAALAELHRRSQTTLQRVVASKNPGQIMILVVENQAAIMKGLALVMDELLAAEGEKREIRVFKTPVRAERAPGPSEARRPS